MSLSILSLKEIITFFFFFFNDTATTEIYTLSLHDALPICRIGQRTQRLGTHPHRQLSGAPPPRAELRHRAATPPDHPPTLTHRANAPRLPGALTRCANPRRQPAAREVWRHARSLLASRACRAAAPSAWSTW